MISPTYHKLKNLTALKFFTAFFLSFTIRTQALNVSFDNIGYAATDFGTMSHNLPLAVIYPQSANDISSFIELIYRIGNSSGLTVAARGNGHSTRGQAQAQGGVVIDMESLRGEEMYFHNEEKPYVDVCGGELWINVLNKSLELGLAPKSWTDYLYLTVGGTLSNGGFSGQAFKHGPQINNVYQLEVVTGKGDIFNCSENENTDLFYGVLGGLGQFGIITQARISLEPAPSRVKWIRALYDEFSSFVNDIEHLISSQDTFDYIEGFVAINSTNPSDLLNHLKSSSKSNGKTQFGIEAAVYYKQNETGIIEQKLRSFLRPLNYIEATISISDVSYVEFLDRVHTSELELRKGGLLEVPHPWLNLLVPKTSIHRFVEEVFGNIVTVPVNGPILMYPVSKSRWRNGTSLVTPDEDIFYLVAILSAAGVPSQTGDEELKHLLTQNKRILKFCEEAKLGVKEYLPHYTTPQDWKAHFGQYWDLFAKRKSTYDPLALLAPGHQIFQRGMASS